MDASNISLENSTGWPTVAAQASPLKATVEIIKLYVMPIIIAVGIIGNTVSLVVFTATKLRSHSSSVYLAALAVSDTCFLLCTLVAWLSRMGLNAMNIQPWCALVVYLTFVCSFLSVWIIVAFTIERFIAVWFPLWRRHLLRPFHARSCVLILVLASLVIYSFLLWMTRVVEQPNGGGKVCHTLPKFTQGLNILTQIDTFLTLVVPLFAIISLNTAIMISLYRSSKRMPVSWSPTTSSKRKQALLRVQHDQRDQSITTISDGTPPTQRTMRSTKMLLIISTVFVLFNLPSHVFRLRYTVIFFLGLEYQPSGNESGLYSISELLYYVNFAVNFFLYSIVASNFRKGLADLIRCIDRPSISKNNYLRTDSAASLTNTQHIRIWSVDVGLCNE